MVCSHGVCHATVRSSEKRKKTPPEFAWEENIQNLETNCRDLFSVLLFSISGVLRFLSMSLTENGFRGMIYQFVQFSAVFAAFGHYPPILGDNSELCYVLQQTIDVRSEAQSIFGKAGMSFAVLIHFETFRPSFGRSVHIHWAHAHWTRRATLWKKWSQVPFCCLLHHALLVACSVNSPVAAIGFVHPNFLPPRVWCARGLCIAPVQDFDLVPLCIKSFS